MGKPKGSIGETKLKILAIISQNDASKSSSYGYSIWKILNEKYSSDLSEDSLRNVYHHLHDLQRQKLITCCSSQSIDGTPARQLYCLTARGVDMKEQFEKHLKAL